MLPAKRSNENIHWNLCPHEWKWEEKCLMSQFIIKSLFTDNEFILIFFLVFYRSSNVKSTISMFELKVGTKMVYHTEREIDTKRNVCYRETWSKWLICSSSSIICFLPLGCCCCCCCCNYYWPSIWFMWFEHTSILNLQLYRKRSSPLDRLTKVKTSWWEQTWVVQWTSQNKAKWFTESIENNLNQFKITYTKTGNW